MPLDARLFLDTTASPEEVKAHLLGTMPFEDEPDFEENKCLHSDATAVQIGRTPAGWNMFETYPDLFRIDHKTYVYFWCLHKTDPVRQELYHVQSFQAIVSLLKHFAGDAVLLLYDDIPMLVRRAGALKLMYYEGGIWDSRSPGNRLSLVDLPYTLEPMPDPFRPRSQRAPD